MKQLFMLIIIFICIATILFIIEIKTQDNPIPETTGGDMFDFKTESALGAGCPNTVNQELLAKCSCPVVNPIYSVGCTQGVSGVDIVEVKGATNVILENKNYVIKDITGSSIKSTAVQTK